MRRAVVMGGCDGWLSIQHEDVLLNSPRHSTIFGFTTGEVEMPPACEDLNAYSARAEDVRIRIEV